MREIKFRVWDNKFLNWIKRPSDIIMNLGTGEVKGKNGGVGYVKHWIVNQFTGLKDKNGVEIYEGDILSEDGYLIGEIYFSNLYGLMIKGESCNRALHNFCLNSEIMNGNLKDLEVIGNIYENKELLK